MLQFLITALLLAFMSWVLTAAVNAGLWAYTLVMAGIFVFIWFMQTDEEKESVKRWWHDRL